MDGLILFLAFLFPEYELKLSLDQLFANKNNILNIHNKYK